MAQVILDSLMIVVLRSLRTSIQVLVPTEGRDQRSVEASFEPLAVHGRAE